MISERNSCDTVRPVVVGITGGPGSDVALSWAAHQAALAGRPLKVVHAHLGPHPGIWADSMISPEDWSAPLLEAGELLAAAVDAVQLWEPDVRVSARSELGTPASLLLAQAETAAMVVLGNDSAGTVVDRLGLTVCGTVAGQAPCPVVTVTAQPAWPDAPIAVGLDAGGAAMQAMEFAFELAARREVEVQLHHVCPREDVDPDRWAYDLLHSPAVSTCAARYPGVQMAVTVSFGDPVERLAEACAEAQLLVVGSRGHGPLARLVTGSVSHALLRRTPGQVAVVRRGCRLRTGVR